MVTRDDEGAPVVYMPSSSGGARRRDPRKLQNIGIAQFRRQGVAHHFNPDSAAALLDKKKAEQFLGESLGHEAVKGSEHGSKARSRDETGLKGGDEDRAARAAIPARKGGMQCTTPSPGAVAPTANMHMAQDEVAVHAFDKHVQKENTVSTALEASTQKHRQNARVPPALAHHLKPSAGAWGRTLLNNAKEAAPYTTSESYATITTITRVGDTTHIRTVLPPPKQPDPAKSYDHSPVQPTQAPAKAARKESVKKRSSKKDKGPMWSDNSDDDIGDHKVDKLLFSSRNEKSHAPRAHDQTTTHTSSSAKRRPILRKKGPHSQTKPQKKRNVRFASPTSSPDSAYVEVKNHFPQHGGDPKFAEKQDSTSTTPTRPPGPMILIFA